MAARSITRVRSQGRITARAAQHLTELIAGAAAEGASNEIFDELRTLRRSDPNVDRVLLSVIASNPDSPIAATLLRAYWKEYAGLRPDDPRPTLERVFAGVQAEAARLRADAGAAAGAQRDALLRQAKRADAA